LIAASCSKNFGIYRERTGILMAVMQDTGAHTLAQGALTHLNRQSYSFPPDHGARLVTMVLSDGDLRTDWQDELDGMRQQMLSLRSALAQELRGRANTERFDFIEAHRGMFSLIGASPAQVARLRDDHAIYIVGDGRINIAGLGMGDVPVLANAMIEVGL